MVLKPEVLIYNLNKQRIPSKRFFCSIIKKSRKSKYTDDEIISGLMKAFSISKKQASHQLKKYDGEI